MACGSVKKNIPMCVSIIYVRFADIWYHFIESVILKKKKKIKNT